MTEAVSKRESWEDMLKREEREERENKALCASEGHAAEELRMYCWICSRCRKVLRYR